MRVVVTGGRNYSDRTAVREMLVELGATAIAHGACGWEDVDLTHVTPEMLDRLRGADRLADQVAIEMGRRANRFPVKHSTDGPWPAAGPRRNRRMLVAFKPDVVLAFPGGRGTASCCAIARELGIPVMEARP